MAKKGLTRKQLLKEPDEFFTLTGRVINWCRQNPRKLIQSACAFLGIIILIVGFGYYRASRSRSASSLLSQGLSKYEADNKTPVDSLSAAKPDFEQLIAKYRGQPAGRLGQVIFAHFNLLGGSLEDAIKEYQQAKDDFGGDVSVENIILNGLASAYEQKGETEAAINWYEKLVQSKSAVYKDTALFHLGLLYFQAGQAEKSVKAYGQLSSEFPNSVFTPIAREKSAG